MNPFSEISSVYRVQNASDWQNQLNSHDKVVAFFVHPLCGACKAYKPVLQSMVALWTQYRQKILPVHFILFDAALIANEPSLNSIVTEFSIKKIPSILFFEKGSLKTELKHRQYAKVETWIQKIFYPEKKVSDMLAICGVYELSKWCQTSKLQVTEETNHKQTLLDYLIENTDNPFLGESTLISWIPFVFKGQKRKLNQVAARCLSNLKEEDQDQAWKNWIQKMLNKNRQSRDLKLDTDYHHLPKNTTVRNFFYKEIYHELLKTLPVKAIS